MEKIIENIKKKEHGFKHIIEAGEQLLSRSRINHYKAPKNIKRCVLPGKNAGCPSVGQLSTNDSSALTILRTRVATDENWRVQEMLAKAFDHYCKISGYENSLPVIKKWLSDKNPNIKRAVVEGLRI